MARRRWCWPSPKSSACDRKPSALSLKRVNTLRAKWEERAETGGDASSVACMTWELGAKGLCLSEGLGVVVLACLAEARQKEGGEDWR